ncbi:hypothetical protein HDA44_005008 [Kribbella solani]|uniref:Uncharacterized protein n=1 Tax=Kribbella solani TaxID=236067 RepID=A0A841DZR7_9ACTN|nr:hypothetical protein [Kribbella solani]
MAQGGALVGRAVGGAVGGAWLVLEGGAVGGAWLVLEGGAARRGRSAVGGGRTVGVGVELGAAARWGRVAGWFGVEVVCCGVGRWYGRVRVAGRLRGSPLNRTVCAWHAEGERVIGEVHV